MSWSNASSRNDSAQENIYLKLRRQMQDIGTSGYSAESQGVKFDLGLHFKKKSAFNSYGYYADEEGQLAACGSKSPVEAEFENRFLQKKTSEDYLRSESAEDSDGRGALEQKTVPFVSPLKGKDGEGQTESKREGAGEGGQTKAIVSPESRKSRKPQLFRNEFITSIGRIESVRSPGEMHSPNFEHRVKHVEELSELFERRAVQKQSLGEAEAANLKLQTQAQNLKNISFKVFDVEKDFKNMTFNHFIDVTADVGEDSREPSVKLEEQKNWSNARVFGTGYNHGVMGDTMDTNNTVNFLITNNSANNMLISPSVSVEQGAGQSRFSQGKNPSDFQTQSKLTRRAERAVEGRGHVLRAHPKGPRRKHPRAEQLGHQRRTEARGLTRFSTSTGPRPRKASSTKASKSAVPSTTPKNPSPSRPETDGAR